MLNQGGVEIALRGASQQVHEGQCSALDGETSGVEVGREWERESRVDAQVHSGVPGVDNMVTPVWREIVGGADARFMHSDVMWKPSMSVVRIFTLFLIGLLGTLVVNAAAGRTKCEWPKPQMKADTDSVHGTFAGTGDDVGSCMLNRQ